jgi:hypothetical protein
MQKIRTLFAYENLGLHFVLVFIAALAYLIFVPWFGYFNDDWYLMYAAGAKGAATFRDIFIVDRPMRAMVMGPAYVLFGNNPVLYNLSAWGFRVLSAIIFFRFLCLLWPDRRKSAWMAALLYLLYPGFLSQFNGIDYQSQMVSLAVAMISLVLLVSAYQSTGTLWRLAIFACLTLTTVFYLGLVEYFIGIEVLKLACIGLLVFRDETEWSVRLKKTLLWAGYSLLSLSFFLIWRLFFFQSERGATDVNLQVGDILMDPAAFLLRSSYVLLGDIWDVVLGALVLPLEKLSDQAAFSQWLPGIAIAICIVYLLWQSLKAGSELDNGGTTRFPWRAEAAWLGVVMLVFGLLPVILVGREVDFKSFTRYALAPSLGVSLLWVVMLDFISSIHLRNAIFCFLITISSLTHYGNALARVRETEITRNFWHQVSWRIPQMEAGTTLIARYPVVAEEDYFTWGPANLIYYPQSANENYVQPSIYAVLLNEDTLDKVLAGEARDFSNRRSIRTYPNYRRILILTQPTSSSCMHVIDLNQVELSSAEDPRVVEIAPHSEADQILTTESFHTPPVIPFGVEPPHEWCYYYEKAAYARQLGDWAEVARLGEEADALGFFAKDQIEWMPFLQAYASLDNLSRLNEIAPFITSDPAAARQACQILSSMSLSSAAEAEIQQLFCLE